MAFNSESYRRNKYRKDALVYLERARAIKARVTSGEAYDWEASRISVFATLARIDWHLYLILKGN